MFRKKPDTGVEEFHAALGGNVIETEGPDGRPMTIATLGFPNGRVKITAGWVDGDGEMPFVSLELPKRAASQLAGHLMGAVL